MKKVIEIPVGKASEEAIIDAAEYLNNHRALASTVDGLKVSARRLIWAALQYKKGELYPSCSIISSVSTYHPHSIDGLKGLHADLVKAGVFTGEGSFGENEITGELGEPAATRYTHSCLSTIYYDSIKPLLKCVPFVDSPVGPLEPSYIPTPLPICLMMKNCVSGIGYGTAAKYPSFSPSSIYAALMKDDPTLLEPNVDIILDKKNSQLNELWNTGKGIVTYGYHLSKYTNEDGKEGFKLSGSTELFMPNLRKIQKYVASGDLFITDLTTIKGPAMMIGLVSGRSKITLGELEELCKQCSYDSTTYTLNVTDGRTSFRIPMRDWCRYVYSNYIDLLNRVNNDSLAKLNVEISIQEALPIISDYIINKNPKATDFELVKNLNIPEDIVKEVLSKPISWLRKNKDTSDRIKLLRERLKELKSFDSVKYTEELIKKL